MELRSLCLLMGLILLVLLWDLFGASASGGLPIFRLLVGAYSFRGLCRLLFLFGFLWPLYDQGGAAAIQVNRVGGEE